METRKIKLVDGDYPKKVKQFLTDAGDLFVRGNIDLLEMKSIGIVGSRKCSAYGRKVTEKVAKICAEENICVVSGLAYGIDAEAHRNAIDNGGKTIAVMATGLNMCYPVQNRTLKEKIEKEGLLISEYPDGTEAKKWFFPIRNRIISALSDIIVVPEANTKSGACITAELAVEQGKRVYAVPSNITSITGMGTNKLIQDGIEPLIVIDDMFREFLGKNRKSTVSKLKLGDDEREILKVLNNYSEVSVDKLCEETGIAPKDINGIITVMEMKGIISVSMNKVFAI